MIYNSEEGKKELAQFLADGKCFSEIMTTADLDIHNYLCRKLRKLGFNEANFEKIVSYVLTLPKEEKDIKTELERAYFEGKIPSFDGKTPSLK